MRIERHSELVSAALHAAAVARRTRAKWDAGWKTGPSYCDLGAACALELMVVDLVDRMTHAEKCEFFEARDAAVIAESRGF
jgi:hypothetical protein